MRRHPRLAALLAVAAMTAGLVAGQTAAGASTKLPVTYNFLASAIQAGTHVDADPPGANIWTCKPSAAHPEPVVLTHGLMGNKNTNWQTYAPLLANNGYCVYSLTYGVNPGTPSGFDQFGGLAKVESSAVQLKTFVAKVLRATRAKKVNIVGHSEGTVMPDYYAKFLGGAKYIDKYVSLAPLWHGTDPAGLATLSQYGTMIGATAAFDQLMSTGFASGPELLTGSSFMAKLRSGGTPAVKGIHYTNIVTKYDELVSPYTSGVQSGMTNFVVQNYCATDYTEHFEIAADPVAAQLVLNTLDPAHKHAVPCMVVLPFTGPVG
jgi:triacylglycerol lipase